MAGRTGQGHHPCNVRFGHEERDARSARDRRDQAPAGIRQAGRRLCQRCSVGRPHRTWPSQGEGMGEDLRRSGKEIWRRALGADRALGHGDRLRRREGSLGRVPFARDARLREISPSLFPQRTVRGDAHHAEQPVSAREDGELMGRRHGADAVHADATWSTTPSTFSATARATSGAMCRTCSLPPAIICTSTTGRPACPGASRCWCRTASTP